MTTPADERPAPPAPRAPRVTACADSTLRSTNLFANPYLRALEDGTMALEQFRASQEQFYYAVRYFPRPMAALVSRIPDPAARLDVLHNLVEEHGDFRPEQFHANTFARFLQSIGGRRPDLAGAAMGPAVHAFNSVLMSACLADELEVGVACMGIIEYAFAGISARIGKAVVRRGWVAEAELTHYALHAELDVRHADEFFAIIEPRWDEERGRLHVRQGLALGAYAFDRLYLSLCEPTPLPTPAAGVPEPEAG